jgi:AraC-like DNA-binding protein
VKTATRDDADFSGSPFPVVAIAKEYLDGHEVTPHVHSRAQLVYANEGTMEVATEKGSWMVPPTQAVWIPPEMKHEVRANGPVSMKTLYISPLASEALPANCRVLNMTPLLRELIICAVAQANRYQVNSREERVVSLIFDEIQDLDSLPFHLPMPRDPRLRLISERTDTIEMSGSTIEELARVAGTSARNLSRLFRKETGMTPGRWKRQARLREALALLASGKTVTEVAFEVGYENASSFISVFHRTFGRTPGRYFRKEE